MKNNTEEKILKHIRNDITIFQMYTFNNCTYFSAAGGHIKSEKTNEIENAIIELIKKRHIDEIESKYKGTRMFKLVEMKLD